MYIVLAPQGRGAGMYCSGKRNILGRQQQMYGPPVHKGSSHSHTVLCDVDKSCEYGNI